jgi:fumarylacetoacetase
VSGTDVIRPCGQVSADEKTPTFAACALLDFELELAMFTGPATKMGHRVSVDNCDQHMFGLALMNDWSARDIQKWEYVPLGPFNAKNFATTISPWIVTFEALEPFAVPLGPQEPEVLPYLKGSNLRNYNIELSVEIENAEGQSTVVSRSNGMFLF